MMDDAEKHYVIEVHDDAKEMLLSHARFVASVSVPAARKLRTNGDKIVQIHTKLDAATIFW